MSPDWPAELDLRELAGSRQRPVTLPRRLERTWQLLRTFPPGQVAARVKRRLKVRWGSFHVPPVPDSLRWRDPVPHLLEIVPHLDRKQAGAAGPRAAELTEGQLTLLNERRPVGWPIDWRQEGPARPSHLWRFHLHYHEFLLDLVDWEDPQAADGESSLPGSIVADWLEHNRLRDRRVHQDAWHPYCISRRLPVWLMLRAAGVLPAELPGVGSVDRQLAQQAEFLAGNLETDLRGNHLLENLYALGLCGCAFEGSWAVRWRQLALRGWRRELEAQCLPSGEHFERSPMYHAIFTGHLCRLALVARGCDSDLHALATEAAQRALNFLFQLRMPDGEPPWLSDSCAGEAPSLVQLEAWALRAGLEIPTAAGGLLGDYWIHRRQSDQLVFDAGPLAASTLPAHGHADLLNLVGAVDGQRLLIDSGNGDYEDGPDRQYARGSLAHNVLTVDHQDHADLWSRFRMGRRGRPGPLVTGQTEAFVWAGAQHDAYRRLGVNRVRRWAASHRRQLFWICLDQVEGGGRHALEGYLHLSAAAQWRGQNPENRWEWQIRFANRDLIVGFLGAERVRPARGWDYPEFGIRRPHPAWVYSASSTESSLVGWYVRPAGNQTCQLALDAGSPQLTLNLDGQITVLRLG